MVYNPSNSGLEGGKARPDEVQSHFGSSTLNDREKEQTMATAGAIPGEDPMEESYHPSYGQIW